MLKTACPLDCPDGCSLEVTVDDGRITRVDADTGPDANPFTQGFICKKVKHHAQRVYSPLRIMTPLIRTGAKGSGEFREASWDEAIEMVADRIRTSIRKHGVKSVVPYLYSSSAGVLAGGGLTPLLFERLGCPEVSHTICAATTGAGWRQVFGGMLSADSADLDHSQLIVIWGANPNVSNTHLIPLITRAVKQHGAKFVVIDPRRTGVAARADLHLAITPGTDVVLAYAVTRWLVEHQCDDTDFLAANTVGADEFIAASQQWTLDRAAAVCGIDAEQIEAYASLVATTSPAMMRIGWGLERNRNGGSGFVAALSMWAVAGHFATLGSGVLKSTGGAEPVDTDRLWPPGVDRPERSVLSMNDVGPAMLGHDVGDGPHAGAHSWPQAKVLFVQGSNPVVTAMDQNQFIQGLLSDGLFTVVHDQVMTDTARYADVVLPAATHFEVSDLAVSYGSFAMQRIEPVIERVGQSRSNDEVAAALAGALGLPTSEFDPDPERLAARVRTDSSSTSIPVIREPGATVQFVHSRPSFADGSVRARLFDPTSELPLPQFVANEGPGLRLLTPSSSRMINSMFGEFDPPEAVISIHPDDADERGIVDGFAVRVFNELGEIHVTARIDGSVRHGVTSIPKGMWMSQFPNGSSPNVLISREINDLAAGACFNDVRVQIERCDAMSEASVAD
ncbi:MAG: molybdopterin-dependent oxidoreductase [Ilumatobacteraceae bacterium]